MGTMALIIILLGCTWSNKSPWGDTDSVDTANEDSGQEGLNEDDSGAAGQIWWQEKNVKLGKLFKSCFPSILIELQSTSH